jgi:hypothetical protein
MVHMLVEVNAKRISTYITAREWRALEALRALDLVRGSIAFEDEGFPENTLELTDRGREALRLAAEKTATLKRTEPPPEPKRSRGRSRVSSHRSARAILD